MTARDVNATSNSDGASSFAYSKVQGRKATGVNDHTPKFSRLLLDSAAEITTAKDLNVSVPRTAPRDKTPAPQRQKDDAHSQTQASAPKAKDVPKKEKAENDDPRDPSVATVPRTNDHLPLTMLFGMPAAQFDGTVLDGEASPSDVSAAGESGAKSTANDPDSSELSTGAATGKGPAAAMTSNNLAFAMRVGDGELQGSPDLKSSTTPSEPASGDAPKTILSPSLSPVAVEASSKASLEQNSHDPKDSQTPQSVLIDPGTARAGATTDAALPPGEQIVSTAADAAEAVREAANSEPVKNVHMQLVSEDNRRVDVRLVDRGGELHVSVKSGDLNLTQDLQSHMHELTSRLDKQHFQTEVWMPKVTEPSKTENGNNRDFSFDRNNRSYSENSEERRGGRQQRKPEWVESLED